MKKVVLFAAAAALISATPAAAQGYLGLEYGNVDIGSGGGDGDKWQGEGAFGWNAGSGFGFQVGGSAGTIDFDGSDADFWSLDGHVYYDGGSWRLGGVAVTSEVDFSPDFTDTSFGVEGMWEFGGGSNVQASYLVGESEFLGTDFDTWNFDAGVNIYATPNIRLGAIAGIGNLDATGGDADTTTYGLNAEFMPLAVPVSFTLGWTRFEVDDSPFESDTISVGARWNFGGGTLQDRNNAVPFNITGAAAGRLLGTQ